MDGKILNIICGHLWYIKCFHSWLPFKPLMIFSYIFHQPCNTNLSIGSGAIFLMLMGGTSSVFGYSNWDSFWPHFFIIASFVLICLKWNPDNQLLAAKFLRQSIYVSATISLATRYHNISGKEFILTECYKRLSSNVLPEFLL